MEQLVAQRISFKKTKRGKIRKLVKEVYLRDDIPCGFECSFCDSLNAPNPSTAPIYVIDERVLSRQQDFLFGDAACSALSLVIPYSSMKDGYDPKLARKFPKNVIVLANEFMRDLFVRFPEIESEENLKERNFQCAIRVTEWLTSHLEVNVTLLTDSDEKAALARQTGAACVTLSEFCDTQRGFYPLVGEKIAWMPAATEIEGDAVYPAHLSDEDVVRGLSEGRFVQGTLRMAMGTCHRGMVNSEIEIDGKVNLNRALDGDLVVVEFEPTDAGELGEEEDEEETAAIDMMQRMEKNEEKLVKTRARIVSIVRRSFREICGTLRPLSDTSSSQSHRTFIPADPRYPYIMLNTKMSAELEGMRIVAVVDSWDRFSKNPSGHWTKILGRAGDRNTESAVILHEHDVITREFSDAVLRCLPPSDYKASDLEISRRLDLRSVVVCSIDPPGCKDIDDALSCEILANGNFRVGVHIADVTHFVLPGSAIDREAAMRCTTVYLVEKRTDMLPGLLTTDLCSLKGNVDRLAFSVLWEVKPDTCEIVKTEYHKTMIHSCAALTYADAQAKIDDSSDQSELAMAIRRLNNVAKKIRAKRMGKGALELASLEVRFELDSETMDPTNVTAYETKDTNKLVEEFMLLANQAVAEQILRNFPSNSILRRHPAPKEAALTKLRKLLELHGITDFKYDTNRELSDSLSRAIRLNDPYFNKLIRIMTTRTMNQAVYFCTGEVDPGLFYHYGLAMELYTHFTSPIRRYADVMAHRLLAASLGLAPIPEEMAEKKLVQAQCEVINYKHRNAQFAGRASTDLHTYLFFKRKGETEVDAVVAGLKRTGRGDPSLSVSVPRFGVEGLVTLKDGEWEMNEDETVLRKVADGTTLSVFDHVIVKVRAEDKDFRYKTCFEILRKAKASEIDDANKAAEMRKQVEAEMFPDRIKEKPDRI